MTLNPLAAALQGVGFGPLLMAVQGLLLPDGEAAPEDEENGSFGVHRRRSWRPAPVAVAAPPKRPRRRRREELLIITP